MGVVLEGPLAYSLSLVTSFLASSLREGAF